MASALYGSIKQTLPDLRIGDILLIHTKGIVIPRLVRRSTASYWSHVALVFDIIPNNTDYPDILIIEAGLKGIEIHRIENYIRYPDKYDVGFKRIPILTAEERDRFRGFFLDAVDTPYDFSRLFSYFTKSSVNFLFGRSIVNWITKRVINLDQFICTSFAQRAFYLAVSKEKREKVLMRKKSKHLNFLFQMEEITPKDYALSENSIWLHNPRR